MGNKRQSGNEFMKENIDSTKYYCFIALASLVHRKKENEIMKENKDKQDLSVIGKKNKVHWKQKLKKKQEERNTKEKINKECSVLALPNR